MTWQPHRARARVAATLGWIALSLVGLALLPWGRSMPGLVGCVGREFAIGVWNMH